MYMTYHGGRCCGIKHIWGMVDGPDSVLVPQGKPPHGEGVGWSHYQYIHERPKETAAQRMDAMIDFARLNWPEHIIEVVVADTSYQKQAQNWNDALIERGFKEVNRNINSNSTNTVVVYHLNVNDKEVAYPIRMKKAKASTPTMTGYDADYRPLPASPPLGPQTRKKATPLPEPIEVTIDGHRMTMLPEGGDVAVPVLPRTTAQKIKAAMA